MPDHPVIEALIQAAMAVLSHDQEQASPLGRWEMAQLRRRFTAILCDLIPAQINDDGPPAQRDAARYRWLCAQFVPRSLHMDGSALWILPSIVLSRAGSVDDAVDVAMERAKG